MDYAAQAVAVQGGGRWKLQTAATAGHRGGAPPLGFCDEEGFCTARSGMGHGKRRPLQTKAAWEGFGIVGYSIVWYSMVC